MRRQEPFRNAQGRRAREVVRRVSPCRRSRVREKGSEDRTESRRWQFFNSLLSLLAGCGKTYVDLCSRHGYQVETRLTRHAGCAKRPSSKAAASKEASRTLRYVEPLSDARTPLVVFFRILLDSHPSRREGPLGIPPMWGPSEGHKLDGDVGLGWLYGNGFELLVQRIRRRS